MAKTVCYVSAVAPAQYTRTIVILRALHQSGWKTEVIGPGFVRPDNEGIWLRHIAIKDPRANFWYNAGIANTIRACLSRIVCFVKMTYLLLRVRRDVLICSEPDAWVAACASKILYGSVVVADLREVYEDRCLAFPAILQETVRLALRAIMTFCSSHTAAVLHVSEARANLYGYLKANYWILACYPHVQRVDPVKSGANEVFGNQNFEGDITIRGIHVGSLRVTYAADELLEALWLAREWGVKFNVVVLGGVAGQIKNGELMCNLEREGYLTLIAQVPREEVWQWMKRSDFGINLVLPIDRAHIFAQPQKLYEYLHAGLAIIGSSVPTIKAVIDESKCGILVDARRPREIAGALMKLANDPKLLNEMRRNSTNSAKELYNWDKEKEVLEVVFEKLQEPNRDMISI